MFYFKKLASVLCLVQAISLGNAMDTPDTLDNSKNMMPVIPSDEELMGKGSSFHEINNKITSDFYYDLAFISEQLSGKRLDDAKTDYSNLRKRFPNHTSPDEKLMDTFFIRILAEQVTKFINKNKTSKDDQIQYMLAHMYYINGKIKDKDFAVLKLALPAFQNHVSEYITDFISKHKNVTDDNIKELMNAYGYVKMYLYNQKSLEEATSALKNILTIQAKTISAENQKSGSNIIPLLESILLIMNEGDPIISDKEDNKQKVEEKIAAQKKLAQEIEREVSERAAKEDAERKEFIKAADIHYKRALKEFELPETATFTDAKKQYGRLMLALHPDKNDNKDTPEREKRRDAVIKAWEYIQAHFRQGLYTGL